MSLHRLRAYTVRLGTAALTALVAACSDAPTTPGAATARPADAPSREVVSPEVYATGLKRLVPLPVSVATQIHVDRNGGKYRLPGGLSIDIPASAFKDPITLTVTALAGDMVAYDFQPHGLVFNRALEMQQDLRGTNWDSHDAANLEIGYFADPGQIYATQNKALINEFLRATVDTKGQKVLFEVFHFSGYMVSTGRSDGSDDSGF